MVNYGLTNIPYKQGVITPIMSTTQEEFVAALKRKMDETGIKAAELARRTGLRKQNISRILTQTPHPITGAPAKTSKEVVLKLARALDWDADEALQLAGFAPLNVPSAYERKVAALFRGAQGWSEKKRQKVLRQIEGLIELVEEEEDN